MDDARRNPIDFGSRGQRWRSTLALCVQYLVDTIQTTVLAQSLSDFTCNLWRRNPIDFGSRSHRSRSTLPPPTLCEGMPRFALSSFYFVMKGILCLTFTNQYDLIDMFNNTSRYLDDIFTIDNPEFEKHIPDIYPTELQLKKVIMSDKETSFLDLNIMLAVMFISVFMTNPMTADFLSSISPGLVVMFLDSHLMLFTFLS